MRKNRAANRTPQDICLVCDGNEYRVVAGKTELMQLTVGDLYMGGAFRVGGIRFQPSCPKRICSLIEPFWDRFVPARHPARVTVRSEQTEQGLRVCVEPDTKGGVADVTDRFEFVRDADSGGWVIEHHGRIVLRRSVKARELGLTPFPDPSGQQQFWWQIDDPLFENNYGPSVPMTNDWLGVFEPTCGPDTFRKHWRRRVESFVFQEPSGRLRTIRFHRARLSALIRQNRRALPIKRGGIAGVVHSDGAGTLYEFIDRRPVFGHICEWGFDTHFWQQVVGNPGTLVLPKGRAFEMSYRIRELSASSMEKLLCRSTSIEPTENDLRNTANVPIYEEPVNRFAIAWREEKARDAWPWIPGPGATWDRSVGRRTSGSLCLDVPLLGMNQGAHWKSTPVGSSFFMNPIVPGARYRLSGYVKIRRNPKSSEVSVPSLSMAFHKFAGPGMFAHQIKPNDEFVGLARGRLIPGRWIKIEATSTPVNGHVMSVTLGCHLNGGGTAWFDELRFEKMDE